METEKIPVSVIIPCYDCQATVSRAARSVAAQTLRPAELILINDGSRDGTADVLKGLREEFGADWVKIITLPENGGQAKARNAGWDAAVCPYIAFLDSDDSWHPEKLAIQYGYMSGHPEVVLAGTECIWSEGGPAEPDRFFKKSMARPVSKFRFMFVSRYFVTSAVMLRRDIPIRFPEDAFWAEDRFLWMKIISEGNKAVHFDIPLTRQYKFPYGQGGITKSLWKMEKGELKGFVRLHKTGLLNSGELFLCVVSSLVKFVRRGCIVFLRKGGRKNGR
ncbi:MAG: glycosyltransferase family 2 protein [Candidatus Paceibacterota bacterium]|jgi:glycosyltransferase involved in cell wall biosynthesis